MVVSIDEMLRQQDVVYVFGYGSLTWKPDFCSDREFVGFIRGYERRFWQGSVHHRGTPDKPGRVLTLTKVQEAVCWGLVFEVRGKEKIASCLDKLCLREQSLGHYEVSMVPVHTAQSSGEEASEHGAPPVNAIVYHALPGNELYTGESSEEEIAFDIATCHGVCGHNLEYLLRLTDFLRERAPLDRDAHVFAVERLVRRWLGLRHGEWHSLLECQAFSRVVDGSADAQTNPYSRSLSRNFADLNTYQPRNLRRKLNTELLYARSDSLDNASDDSAGCDSSLDDSLSSASSTSNLNDSLDDELNSSELNDKVVGHERSLHEETDGRSSSLEDLFSMSSDEECCGSDADDFASFSSDDERTIADAMSVLNLRLTAL